MSKWEKWETVLIYTIVIVGTISLRFVMDYPENVITLAYSVLDMCARIAEYMGLLGFVVLLQQIPIKLLLAICGSAQIFIGFLVLVCFKRVMEQGTMIFIENNRQVIKSGVILYLMALSLTGVFIYSVIGIPVGIGFLAIAYFASTIGNIPLAIYIGYLLSERLSISGYTYIYYFIGSFVMLFCEGVYAIGGAFLFFIFPVLSIGVFFVLLRNRFLHKLSYPLKFSVKKGQENFDRRKIRDIITR